MTSPCEENFQDRHFDKIARYEALCVSIREDGWRHHLFAIEVGARGYCAYNVCSCFRRLGLNTKETEVVLSELTSTAIQCSFVIWLNRDNKIWNEQATSTFDIPKKAPRKHTPLKNKASKHSNAKYSQPLSKFYRPGFINKGNTCYMNALLQDLTVVTGFWSTLPALASEEQDISSLVAAYCQIMFFLKSSKNPIDPSCFLDAFYHFMVSIERGDFVVNSQQDVPEVLNYLLDNFCGISVLAQDQIKVFIWNRITCTNCLQSDDREDTHMIVTGNVNSAFINFLNEEVILNRECPVCLSKHNACLEKRMLVAGKYVIIHLKKYLLNDGGWLKDISLVNCVSEQLSFSVDLDDDVQCRKCYQLVASICHSGTLAAGHYTAHVLHKQDSQCLLCNDKAVLPLQSSVVDNKYSCVLFYELS